MFFYRKNVKLKIKVFYGVFCILYTEYSKNYTNNLFKKNINVKNNVTIFLQFTMNLY